MKSGTTRAAFPLSVAVLLLAGCLSTPRVGADRCYRTACDKTPPLEVEIAEDTGWSVGTVAIGNRISVDRHYAFGQVPEEVLGAQCVRRHQGELRQGLDGEVELSRDATMYVAIMHTYNRKTESSRTDLRALRSRGWKTVRGPFRISENPGEEWQWTVVRKQVPAGPVCFGDGTAANKVFMFK